MLRHARTAALLAAITAAAGSLATARDADPPLLAGYAEVDITPPLGGSMPGYFGDRQATEVLDPLKSKVVYLRKGDESLAIVASDLIGVGAPLVERVRAAAGRHAAAASVSAPRFTWVHGTHTHTGGMVPRGNTFTSDSDSIYPGFYPGTVNEAWVESYVEKTAAAIVRAARAAREEQRLTLHEGHQDTVAFYRRWLLKDGTVRTNPGRGNPNLLRPLGRIDPRVHVLRFEAARLLTVIYGMHPDCVSGTRYSADFPGHLTDALKEQVGKDWNVLFLNAACGNINHVNVDDPTQKSGPEESRRIGRALAGAVVAALRREQPLSPDPLRVATTQVVSRLRKPPPAELAEAEDRLRTNRNPFEFNGLFAPAAVILGKTRDREHSAEIAAFRLGGMGFAALPGEIFVELAREVEAGSPFRPTRTIGLTNGSMGYIPNLRGYQEGGYEANYRSARYEPDTGHRWAAAAARMLREFAK